MTDVQIRGIFAAQQAVLMTLAALCPAPQRFAELLPKVLEGALNHQPDLEVQGVISAFEEQFLAALALWSRAGGG